MDDHDTTVSLADLAEQLAEDLRRLEREDGDIGEVARSAAGIALISELRRAGVDDVPVTGLAADTRDGQGDLDSLDPDARAMTLMASGAMALHQRGFAQPDIAAYEAATQAANDTGQALPSVIEAMNGFRPFELSVGDNNTGNITINIGAINIGNSGPANGMVGMLPGGDVHGCFGGGLVPTEPTEPVAEIPDVEPIEYQDYDVHLMSYPIKETFGLAQHTFVVAVESGTETDAASLREAIEEGRGFATRAGADGFLHVPNTVLPFLPPKIGGFIGKAIGFLGNFLNPAPDGRQQEGDVYVADFDEALSDLDQDKVRILETTTISANLDQIQGQVADFREFLNEADIDYNLLKRNSNTYAGDVYEKLTGDTPTNTDWRPAPGMAGDLIDYSETEYAGGLV